MRPTFKKSLMILSTLCLLTSCFKAESFRIVKYREENPKKINDSLASFLFGDMHGLTVGTLRTNAVPVKLALAAIILEKQDSDKRVKLNNDEIKKTFKSWGFFYSDSLPAGWNKAEKLPTHPYLPIGMDSGEILGHEGKERIEIMNFNCASCHTGTGYNADGKPNFKHIPGLPNTSLNLDKFLADVFSGLLRYSNDKDFADRIYVAMEVLFPEVTKKEITTLKLMHPVFKSTLNKFNEKFGSFLPTDFGGSGQSNAVGLFKSRFKVQKFEAKDPNEASYVSIPTLYKKGLRSSLLVDGSTAPVGDEFFREMNLADVTPEHLKKLAYSAVYFPVLVTGASEKGAIKELPELEKIITYFTRTTPEKFPGKIDQVKAARGRVQFENRCSSCHGRYEGDLLNQEIVSFPNKLVDLEKIKTDAKRVDGITQELVDNLGKSKIGEFFEAKTTHGYVAPMLSAVWATAPYFHNGSVPSLWDVMHPESRPETFKVGGHMLDFNKVGISFPEGYTPWTAPTFYNTKTLGRGNGGHEFPFNKMSEEEKSDVLEYLKLL
jgi:mono/diheme cytochrome c family protein